MNMHAPPSPSCASCHVPADQAAASRASQPSTRGPRDCSSPFSQLGPMIAVLPYKLYLRFHTDGAETICEIERHPGAFFLSCGHDEYRAYCSDFGPIDLGKVGSLHQTLSGRTPTGLLGICYSINLDPGPCLLGVCFASALPLLNPQLLTLSTPNLSRLSRFAESCAKSFRNLDCVVARSSTTRTADTSRPTPRSRWRLSWCLSRGARPRRPGRRSRASTHPRGSRFGMRRISPPPSISRHSTACTGWRAAGADDCDPRDQRDWYCIAEKPAPAPHLARPEGRATLTHMF